MRISKIILGCVGLLAGLVFYSYLVVEFKAADEMASVNLADSNY